MKSAPQISKKRLVLAFAIICVLCTVLTFRIGWIQVVKGEEYSKKATTIQTRDIPIPAKRGIIYDRNNKELAISAVTFSVWARPASIATSNNKDKNEIKTEKTAREIADVLGMDKDEVRGIITQKDKSLVKIAKYVEKEKADKIREVVREEELSGIEIAEDVKRYYPMGAFASHVLGSVTDDNNGLAGIEMKYNQYLGGIKGRWIKNADAAGNSLSYGTEKYYKAEDGLNIVLTIDEVIQHFVEKAIETAQTTTQGKRVWSIVMDPKTGDVLAMAATNDYDPNNPRVPLDPVEAAYVETLSDAEQMDYWNAMWRNPLISDLYEPGSPFKLITTAMALEEGLTNPNEGFYCSGSMKVATETLKCWRWYSPHGQQNLTQAVGNSCNPVFITLAQRIGVEKFYQYLELFGFMDKTGVDFPGESYSILQNKDTAWPVGLSTMSYGQGIAVTPLQMLTSICALGNDGKLMQPRIVKALTDEDGKAVEAFDTKVVRQVISQQTADQLCVIMEAVVSEGGGKIAQVPGYRIGGKTGTSYKPEKGIYNKSTTWSSFIGMAPMDDPQMAVLVVIDEPKGESFGSTTAGPAAKTIFEETLRYMNIAPHYTQEEQAATANQMIAAPNIVGKTFEEAAATLAKAGLTYKVSPELTEENKTFEVLDQYPKAGEKIKTGGTVYLYRK